jgi:hypothetical protein
LAPLVGAVLQKIPEGAQPSAAAAVVGQWAMPMGWLVCRCADLRKGQVEMMRAAVDHLAGRGMMAHSAPLLKAMWDEQVRLRRLWLRPRAHVPRTFPSPCPAPHPRMHLPNFTFQS